MMSPSKARVQDCRSAWKQQVSDIARKVTPLKKMAHKVINGITYKEDPVTGNWIPT